MCAQRKNENSWSTSLYNDLTEHFASKSPFIVINYDYDGLLSAALLMAHFPSARIVGAYDLERIARTSQSNSWRDLGKAVWVDCAIDSNDIFCIDQHMIEVDIADQIYENWHPSSLNPNGFMEEYEFTRKYPFSCSEIIYTMLERNRNSLDEAYQLTVHQIAALANADSSWYNHFMHTENCDRWIQSEFHNIDEQYFQNVRRVFSSRYDSEAYSAYWEFYDAAQDYLGLPRKLRSVRLEQTPARPWWAGFRSLTNFIGYNLENDDSSTHVHNCLRHLNQIFGWNINTEHFGEIVEIHDDGRAREWSLSNSVRRGEGSLRRCLEDQDVFSHAITLKDKISVTVGRQVVLNLILDSSN